jgi:hypothetical protein
MQTMNSYHLKDPRPKSLDPDCPSPFSIDVTQPVKGGASPSRTDERNYFLSNQYDGFQVFNRKLL